MGVKINSRITKNQAVDMAAQKPCRQHGSYSKEPNPGPAIRLTIASVFKALNPSRSTRFQNLLNSAFDEKEISKRRVKNSRNSS